ncbi:hypothetical protein JST97_03200 [bacterium]|nr:hypothetical protein [bacterium]
MRKKILLSLVLTLVAVPLAKPKPGAVGVDEGSFALKVKAADREIGVNQSQFDDYSASLTVLNASDSQINLVGANAKDNRNVNVMMTFRAQAQGTFEVGNGQPNHFEFHSSAYPQPDTAPFFVVKQGTLEVTSYPAVGGYASGTFHGTCQWLGLDMQPVETFEADLTFRVKRLL